MTDVCTMLAKSSGRAPEQLRQLKISDGRKQEKATHTPMLKVFKDFMTHNETKHTNNDKTSLNQEKTRVHDEKAALVKEKRKKRRPERKSYEQKSLESITKVKQKRPVQAYDNAAYNDHCDHHFAYQGAGGAGGDTPDRMQSSHKYKPLSEKRDSWWLWHDRQPSKTGHNKRDRGYSSTGSGVSCQFKKMFCNEYAGAIWLIIMFACTVLGAFFYAFKILWMQPPAADQLYLNPYLGVTPLGSRDEILITPPIRRQEFGGHRRNAFGDAPLQNKDMAELYESYLSGAGDAGYAENPSQSSFHPSYGLSNALELNKFSDQNLSPKIKDFYRRLLETDEQIQNLKKGIFKNSQEMTSHQKINLSPYESMYRLKRSLFHNKKKKKLKKGNSPKVETKFSMDENTLLVNESGKEKDKDKFKQKSGRKRWGIFRHHSGKKAKMRSDKRVKRFPNGSEILDIIDKGVNLLVGVIDKPKFKKCSHKERQGGDTDDDKMKELKYKHVIPEREEKIPEKYEERIEYNKEKAKELSKELLNNFTLPQRQDTNIDLISNDLASNKSLKNDVIRSRRRLLSVNEMENSELEVLESFVYPEEADSLVQAYSDYGVLKDKGQNFRADEDKSVNSTTGDLVRNQRSAKSLFYQTHSPQNNLESLNEDLVTSDIPKVTDDVTDKYTDFLNFVRKHLRLLSTKKTEDNKGKPLTNREISFRIKHADMESLENINRESMKRGNRRKRDISENFGNKSADTDVVFLDNDTKIKDIKQEATNSKERASLIYKSFKNKEAENDHRNGRDHRSRKLLSIVEDNFNVSDKHRQDIKKIGGNSSLETNSTPSMSTIKITVSGQEVNSTNENKSVVKRSASDSNFMFWNNIYDEDYGTDMDENKPIERSDGLNGNWIQNKLRKMKDSFKSNARKEFNKLYDSKRDKRTEEAGLNDDSEEFAQDDEPNNPDNFDSLMDHMKKVCEKASKAVRETRNLKREDEESEMTSGLMQNMVRMLSELVDYQVQQKTCLTLSPDLRGFLDWLTLPQTLQASSQSKDKQDTKVSTTVTTPEDEEAILDLTSTQTSEKEDHSNVRSECLGTLQAVQSLIDEYAQLSEEDKSSMDGVKEYLEGQLNYLNQQLDNINKDRNIDTNNQAVMPYKYRRNNVRYRNPKNKYEKGLKAPRLPQKRRMKRKFIKYNKKYTSLTPNNFESAEISTENYKKRSVDRNDLIKEETHQNNITNENSEENKENSNDIEVKKDNTSKRNLKDVYYLAIKEAKKTSPKSSPQKRLQMETDKFLNNRYFTRML